MSAGTSVQYRCTQPITLNGKLNLISRGLIGARWVLLRSGLGATNHFESCAFIRSRAGQEWPDVQYHFLLAAMRYDGRAAFKGHGFQVHVGPNKLKLAGLHPPDPRDHRPARVRRLSRAGNPAGRERPLG
jgi:choline dehydrogenase